MNEHLPIRAIFLVGTAALVVFGLATYLSDRVRMQRSAELGPPAEAPREIGRSKIGLVEQSPFEWEPKGVAIRREQLIHLNSYGWVDRNKGIVHVPISVAIDDLIKEQARR